MVIHYTCPDDNRPIGGIKVIYQHVEMLNEMGIPADVLHTKKNFQCDWFEHAAKVTSLDDVVITNTDVLVYPEVRTYTMLNDFPGVPKVVFNQNAYYTFRFGTRDQVLQAYASDDLVGVMTVSDDTQHYMECLTPETRVGKVRNIIDSSLFNTTGRPASSNVIAVMPRKLKEDQDQVLGFLEARNALTGYTIDAIDGVSATEVAKRLKNAAIFLSFSGQEGFGLPPAEAMACGCVVVGYDGWAGAEYLQKPVAFPVPNRNVLSFVKQAESVIGFARSDPARFASIGPAASSLILGKYSRELAKKDLQQFWTPILNYL